MPASPSNPPWPERTAASSPPLAGQHASTSKTARQVIADQAAVEAAETQCQIFSGNEVISCFPTADTVIAQHEFATFVWNSNNPNFLQTERVDIYLFHGDSQEQILSILDEVNPAGQAGHVSRQVNDTWWGTRGANWDGTNISYPFYWLIARHGESLDDGTLIPQTTFSAVQTTFADSVLATRSSSSAATATSSFTQALVTSSTPSVVSIVSTTQGPPGGGIQSNSSTPFPHWAIIIIVLGIVAVVAVCGLMFFGIFFLREREKRDRYPIRQTSPGPEMVQADEAAPVAAAAASGLAGDTVRKSHAHDRNTSPEPRQFSGSDAAIMANAFRAELRQPPRSFDDDEEEEDADADANEDVEEATTAPERPDAVRERETLLRRGLASEGADIRSVDSVRGVRVESSNESHGHGRTSPRMSI